MMAGGIHAIQAARTGSCGVLTKMRSPVRLNPVNHSQRVVLATLHVQSDAYLSSIVIGEANTGLLKSFLYFQDRGEIPFHHSLILLDTSQSCETDAGLSGKPVLTPA
jgi:hypothetical protein